MTGVQTCALPIYKRYLADPSLRAILDRLKNHPRIDGKAVARFAVGWPKGQNHPLAWFPFQRRRKDSGDRKSVV